MKAFFFLFAMVMAGGVAAVAVGIAVSLLTVVVLAFAAKWVPLVYNVRSLGRRRVTTTLALAGMALGVAVFSTSLMLVQGMLRTLRASGRTDNVIALRKGSTAEITSAVTREQVRLLESMDEIALDPKDGKPLVEPQLSILIFGQRAGGGPLDGTNLLIRGLTERQASLHDNIHVAEGRWFKPGTSEIVIGRALVGRFVGASLDTEMNFARRGWKVVGILDTGSSYDSEIWCDADQAMDAFQRTTYSTVTMRLKDPKQLGELARRVSEDPRLSLDLKEEQRYFEDLSNGLKDFLGILGLIVAVVFSFAATLGAMISMYGQVAARLREVGTLRAIGFRRSSVLVSFVLESTLLGLVAGAVGLALSSLMRFATFSTINFNTFSEVTFRFMLTPQVAMSALLFGALMGYVGGLLPAVRAARMPIVQATRG